jgi:hypothetical protein
LFFRQTLGLEASHLRKPTLFLGSPLLIRPALLCGKTLSLEASSLCKPAFLLHSPLLFGKTLDLQSPLLGEAALLLCSPLLLFGATLFFRQTLGLEAAGLRKPAFLLGSPLLVYSTLLFCQPLSLQPPLLGEAAFFLSSALRPDLALAISPFGHLARFQHLKSPLLGLRTRPGEHFSLFGLLPLFDGLA